VQIATFLATYQPGLAGDYEVGWTFLVDGYVHRLLSELAGLPRQLAVLIHVQSARLTVDHTIASDLRLPENEIPVTVHYRVNDLPATFISRILFYAGDIETLEPVHDIKPTSLSC
jgi:hypothetical protein